MLELDTPAALPYVAARLNVAESALRMTALGGGISNLVYLAEAPGVRCVLKQALEKLRVEQDWFCSRDRIHRECAAMRALGAVLPAGAVPAIYFEDAENHIIAMEGAQPGAHAWKQLLLEGEIYEETAARLGQLHGAWLRHCSSRSEWKEEFGDLTVFEDLRVDPYYRTTAVRHPDLEPHFALLINQCLERRISLVHGDLSPKNLLVTSGAVMLIDFEVIHWGDPSFDMAFLLNHLLLKSFFKPEWRNRYLALAAAYRDALLAEAGPAMAWMEPAAMRHLAGLLLARIDGKSPAEYITDTGLQQRIRTAARRLFDAAPNRTEDAFAEALA